jgi:hypothetical protein
MYSGDSTDMHKQVAGGDFAAEDFVVLGEDFAGSHRSGAFMLSEALRVKVQPGAGAALDERLGHSGGLRGGELTEAGVVQRQLQSAL